MHWCPLLQCCGYSESIILRCRCGYWVLDFRQHQSWADVRQFASMRHAAKLWGRCRNGHHWDGFCAMQHWHLIGHMVRSSASTLPCATLTSKIHVGALHQGRRRYRRGPDYTNAGQVSQFLRVGVCASRVAWPSLESHWVQYCSADPGGGLKGGAGTCRAHVFQPSLFTRCALWILVLVILLPR